ncbi:MAG TPA: GAF domain-containing sensor histidine kinase [Anaerolineae bacterium]|nr:GAF domain-containing sensor histidine kinase [Anaerolineae bacterium]
MTDRERNDPPGDHGLKVKVVQVVDTAIHYWPTPDLRGILHTVLEQLGQLIDCDTCAILLIADGTLRLTAVCGPPEVAKAERLMFNLEKHPDLQDLIHDRRPVVLPDVASIGSFVGVTPFRSMRACLAAPMVYQDRPIGVLLVLKEEPGYYAEKDAGTAMVLASQAAIAIENARLYAETRRRALQLEAASQAGQKATSILDIDELLAEVVRLIREMLSYHHVHLFLVDGHSNEIALRECSGPADGSLKAHGLRLKIGEQGITGWVAGTGQPLLCNDVNQEPRYHPHELLPETRSELAIPLRVGSVVVGVLDVQSEQLGAFHDDDVTVLQILADQVAIAIENAHLFRKSRQQYEAMRALHDISLDITSRLESEQVLRAILRQAAHLLSAQGSSLAVCDPQADLVRVIAIHNLPPEYQGVDLRPGEGAAGQVVLTGQSLIVNDYRHWPGRSPVFDASPYDAVLSVPLRWQGEVFGALSVVDQGEHRPFTEDDVQLLSLFADLATIALKNAELYAQVRQTGEQLEQKVEQRTGELARAQDELAKKAEELQRLLRITVQVQEEERTRIARDLHDGSNQLITAALYEIQAAQESIGGQRREVALQKLEIAKGLLRSIEAENRQIISGLHPPVLDAQGLAPALKWHATGFQKHYGVACALKVSGQPLRLSPEAETAVYRIVQEALNNVAAHAQAHRVEVRVEFKPERLRVLVEDDGAGFDYGSALTKVSGQMGLIGMRERAQSIGGQIQIQSMPGQGTRLTLDVPLPSLPTSETGAIVNARKL